VEDALNIAVKMEAYQASVVPPESDKGVVEHKAKHKVKSAYAMEGTELDAPDDTSGQRSRGKALIETQLADLQKQCNSNREALGHLKAQKEEAEKKVAQAAQAAKAAAHTAKSASPPASTAGSTTNPGGCNGRFQRPQGGYRGRGLGRGNYQAKSDDVCHKCGGQGHLARDCPNGTPPEQPAAPPAPAAAKIVDYQAE